MRTLRSGHAAGDVVSWQNFLKQKGYLPQDFTPSRLFDDATTEATKAFQRDSGLNDNGTVGPLTTKAAMAKGFEPPPFVFELGPDRGPSLRESRPYFLVPLDDPDSKSLDRDSQLEEVRARIRDYVPAMLTELGGEITDVYVISHGWHRNFFDAVAAYDRLSSRLALLIHRGRIKPGKSYRPLFLDIHWHSDPGEDNWTDPAGRRDKSSFIAAAQAVFEMREEGSRCFVNDFEDIFELFTRMSAPGSRALSDETLWAMNDRLSGLTSETVGKGILDFYDLADMPPTKPGAKTESEHPPTTAADKVVIVWKCYEEARAKRVLVDQSENEPPGEFMSPGRATGVLFNYVLGVVSVGALVGAFWTIAKPLRGWVWSQLSRFWVWLIGLCPASWWPWCKVAAAAAIVYLPLWLASRLYLEHRAKRAIERTDSQSAAPSNVGSPKESGYEEQARFDRGSRGIPFLPILAALILEMVVIPLILLWLLVNYFILGSIMKGRWLFDERIGRRGDDLEVQGADPKQFKEMADQEEQHAAKRKFIEVLAELGRTPLRLLRASTAADSSVNRAAGQIDNQLAFFEMQRKGVLTGRRAAVFVESLLAKLETPSVDNRKVLADDVRIHILGHSFGGLVTANAARHLALEFGRPVHTVCLVQGAMASYWFKKESSLFKMITGVVGCIYSRYDAANSFIYPVGNQARLAAGAVGLDTNPPAESRGKEGRFASLPRPPQLKVRALPSYLNADASRLIYEGPPLTNGGHDDIFKDDVVNLMWAITTVKAALPDSAEE
jgi:hypothetical protein